MFLLCGKVEEHCGVSDTREKAALAYEIERGPRQDGNSTKALVHLARESSI